MLVSIPNVLTLSPVRRKFKMPQVSTSRCHLIADEAWLGADAGLLTGLPVGCRGRRGRLCVTCCRVEGWTWTTI